jgi:ubiquinone/menaquinone biosynthesis C-methylase UbiE
MTTKIHDIAAKGFQSASAVYDRGRPEYPLDAVEHLLQELNVGPASTVVEIGAGTGKFTKLLATLVPFGARVIAVEPVEGMRKKFSELLPSVELLSGSAESIPLAPGAANAVIAAQAFHWFNGPVALGEIRRVLQLGGKLGLIWNVRDESVDWVAQLEQLTHVYQKGVPRYRTGAWRQTFERTELFTPLRSVQFRFTQVGGHEMVVDRLKSASFIAALPEAEKSRALDQVRELLSTHPQTKGKDVIEFPYRTDVFWCGCKGI